MPRTSRLLRQQGAQHLTHSPPEHPLRRYELAARRARRGIEGPPCYRQFMRQPATSRIRLLPVSTTSRSPAASTATPSGRLSSAPRAGPPSPENPPVPFPATV